MPLEYKLASAIPIILSPGPVGLIQVLNTLQLFKVSFDLRDENVQLTRWLADTLHSIEVGDFGPLDRHLDLAAIYHKYIC